MFWFKALIRFLIQPEVKPQAKPVPTPTPTPAPPVPTPVRPKPDLLDRLANQLSIKLAYLLAVIEVEAGGSFEWRNGRLPCLFERHVFYRIIAQAHGEGVAIRLNRTHPHLCNRAAGAYGTHSAQYDKLHQLEQLGYTEEAWQATSWGAFQIMGHHFERCGFESATDMVDFMSRGPIRDATIEVFARFIKTYKNGDALEALRRGDFKSFAFMYNGSGYAKNQYDVKLEHAAEKFSQR